MKKFFLVAAFIFAGASSFADIIEKIEFSGLKRTSKSYAESFFSDVIGRDSSELNTEELQSRLIIAGLFEKVEATIEGDTLKIEVKEKISLIPMPFAMYSNDGFMGGAMLMDMNAFGRQDMVMGGVFFGATKFSGIAIFTKKQRGKVPGLSLTANVAKNIEKFATIDDSNFYKGDKFKLAFSGGLNYKLGKFTTVQAGFRYEYQNTENETICYGDKFSKDFNDIHIFTPNLGVTLSTKPVWNGFFTYTNSISVSADFNTTNNGNFAPLLLAAANLNGKIGTPRLVYHFFLTSASLFNAPINCFFNKSKGGLTILPTNFKTTAIDSFVVDLEVAALKVPFALFSLYGRYETAFVRLDYKDDFKFTHGPSAGLKMYLSKVAFPALALGCSYNVTENLFLFAFSFGMGM